MDFFYELPEECATCVEELAVASTVKKGEYYRIGKEGCSMQESFIPQYFLKDVKLRGHICHNCGVSVFEKIEDAISCRSKYKKIGNIFLRGNISTQTDGPILPTECCPPHGPIRIWKKSHSDWYQLKNIKLDSIFSIIASAL